MYPDIYSPFRFFQFIDFAWGMEWIRKARTKVIKYYNYVLDFVYRIKEWNGFQRRFENQESKSRLNQCSPLGSPVSPSSKRMQIEHFDSWFSSAFDSRFDSFIHNLARNCSIQLFSFSLFGFIPCLKQNRSIEKSKTDWKHVNWLEKVENQESKLQTHDFS